MKKTYLILTLVILIVIGYSTDSISFQRGEKTDLVYEEKSSQTRENISGTLVSYPHLQKTRDQLLQENKTGLSGQVYNITNKETKKQFKRLASEQKNISIIMENQQYRQHRNTFKQLEQEFIDYPNIQLQNDWLMNTTYVHAKFFLMDKKSVIQTANLTYGGLNDSKEHMFITNNTGIYQSLNTIFTKDRTGKKITTKDIHPNLVVCNINCRSIIQDMLNNANESIHIATQYIADPNIINILQYKNSYTENITLQLITSDNNINKDLEYHFGPEVRKTYTSQYLHTKTILIDKKVLLVGSMNLSTNSLDNNREVGIILTDPIIIQNYLQDFSTMRDKSK